MKVIIEFLMKGFFMPGTVVLNKMGVRIEDDGGILRSFINMCFWGTIGLFVALSIYG